MFILLPLSDAGLPKNIEEKKTIIHTIYDEALRLGFAKEDIIVDGLVATVGANRNAALETIETIHYCKNELGLATICGLSNISFGLPERGFVNTAFLTMAIANGLTMAIANPSQDLLMNVAFASDLLLNKEGADVRYIENVKPLAVTAGKVLADSGRQDGTNRKTESSSNGMENVHSKLFENVLKGNKRTMIEDVKAFLAEGNDPQKVIEEHLIPAINEVGVLFDQKKYFLPQLISSAEAMETAISYVEPLLPKKDNDTETATIVVATVEGDIHDIGKNLVVLMLKNYGYHVIDLGKDVPKEVIVETAMKENASIIGLSALMTTTMMRMKDVVEYAKEKNAGAKIIIGGAVITQSFADEIGADGYSKDAAEACRVVERLLSE